MPELSNRLSVEGDKAAVHTGLTKSTLNKYRGTGYGPRYLKIGRRVLYDTADLDVWLDQHKRRSTADTGEVA